MPQTLTEEQCRSPKYWCPQCKEWKLGTPKERAYNDIGFLCGSAGTECLCTDCDSVVSRKAHTVRSSSRPWQDSSLRVRRRLAWISTRRFVSEVTGPLAEVLAGNQRSVMRIAGEPF